MATISVLNGTHLMEGIQLRERNFVPKWFGRFVIWIFFHRLDTRTEITISGLSGPAPEQRRGKVGT